MIISNKIAKENYKGYINKNTNRIKELIKLITME